MKKILFFALVAIVAYQFFPFNGPIDSSDAFDAEGNPAVLLFVGPACNEPCENIEKEIRGRGIGLEVIDVTSEAGERFGVQTYPLTVAGNRRVAGTSIVPIIGMLAEVYGERVLNPSESRAMRGHFDQNGKPRVILYVTKWCGFCKRQRELFRKEGVEFVDVDVEESSAGMRSYNTLRGGGYPLVYVGYRRFEGYRENDLLAAIDELVR